MCPVRATFGRGDRLDVQEIRRVVFPRSSLFVRVVAERRRYGHEGAVSHEQRLIRRRSGYGERSESPLDLCSWRARRRPAPDRPVRETSPECRRVIRTWWCRARSQEPRSPRDGPAGRTDVTRGGHPGCPPLDRVFDVVQRASAPCLRRCGPCRGWRRFRHWRTGLVSRSSRGCTVRGHRPAPRPE